MQVIYPTVKAKGAGFVPMVTIRGERGQMRGSVVAKGEPCGHLVALAEAHIVALRVLADNPHLAKIAGARS